MSNSTSSTSNRNAKADPSETLVHIPTAIPILSSRPLPKKQKTMESSSRPAGPRDKGKDKVTRPLWFSTLTTILRPVTSEDIKSLGSIPSTYKIQIPEPNDHPDSPPPGYQTFFVDQLRSGLRFPIHYFCEGVSRFFGVPINQYAGFQCNQNTIHLQCQTCGGMMPSRSNASVPQHCLGCDRAYCGAYWHSLGVTGSDIHPVCSLEILKPITERSVSRIPFLVHEKNRHEQDITEKCLSQMGRSLHDVISKWVMKMNNREIDRRRLPLNHSEMINPQTYICNECYDKLVSFLLYWFRVTLPKHYLPPEALQREDCWYGSACRTQHHNEEHARKRNHVCRPTRGTYMW